MNLGRELGRRGCGWLVCGMGGWDGMGDFGEKSGVVFVEGGLVLWEL